MLLLRDTARELGNPRLANILALGASAACGNLVPAGLLGEKVVDLALSRLCARNAEAFDAGLELAASSDGVAV